MEESNDLDNEQTKNAAMVWNRDNWPENKKRPLFGKKYIYIYINLAETSRQC